MSVSTSITIQDRITSRMNRITAAMERTARAAQAVDVATSQPDMGVAYSRVESRINAAEVEVDSFNRKQEQASVQAYGISAGWSQIKGAIQSAAAILGVSKLFSLSDSMATTQARLDLMNDGLQTTAALQKMIMASANRARASYQTTADAVSKLGIMAKDAFGSNAELIAFSELINKQFAIAGTSATGIDAAMLQLTQSMASGVLRGEELNSVFEQAPTIIQTIADYLDVPIGKIRTMAADGEITASIVKNAMLSAAEDINAKFEAMPMTWSQVGARAANMALLALRPVLAGINWLANNIGIIGPLVLGLGAAFAVFQVAAHWTTIAGIATGAYHAVVGLLSIGFGILTGNTAAASAAVFQFNSALLASPVTWVIMLVVILIGALYAGVAAYNKFTGSAVSATGIIGGAFAVLGAFLINTFLIRLWNEFAAIANFFGNVFNNPVAAVQVLFYDMAMNVIGYIRNMAAAIEGLLNKIPGVQVDITSGLDSFYNGLEKASQAVKDESGWVEYVQRRDFIDYGSAAQSGYNFGQGIEDKVGNFFGFGSGDDAVSNLLSGNIDSVGSVGEVGKINDDVNIADEDLKLMRDVAEMRYVQNFVRLTPTVSMNAQVSEKADVNEVVSEIERRLESEFSMAAEGVYA